MKWGGRIHTVWTDRDKPTSGQKRGPCVTRVPPCTGVQFRRSSPSIHGVVRQLPGAWQGPEIVCETCVHVSGFLGRHPRPSADFPRCLWLQRGSEALSEERKHEREVFSGGKIKTHGSGRTNCVLWTVGSQVLPRGALSPSRRAVNRGRLSPGLREPQITARQLWKWYFGQVFEEFHSTRSVHRKN